jgi:ankyrin repeat protein
VHILCQGNWTPLHIAVSRRNIETVKHLLEAGANLELQTKEGWTALHIAVQLDGNAGMSITQLLVEHGGNINAITKVITLSTSIAKYIQMEIT